MSEGNNELRQQVAVLEERMNSMKAENKSARAGNESAIDRLRVAIAEDAKDRARWDRFFVASVYGVGIAILAALSPLNPFSDEERQSAPPPAPVSAAAPATAPALASPLVVINLPPGAQMPAVQGGEVQGGEVQVLPPPAPSAAPLGEGAEE